MTQVMKTLSAISVGVALFVSAQANAATTATLKVTGSIVPAACSAALANNGEVSFGNIAAASIRKAPEGNALVQLGSKDITLNISCEANAAIGFKMIDNRASSAVVLTADTASITSPFTGEPVAQTYFGFGLGQASNNAKIGSYIVSVDVANATVDGGSAPMLFVDQSAPDRWRVTTDYVTQKNNDQRIVTFANQSGTEPMMFKEATVPLRISAGVQTSSVLGGDAITLDGNATVSLVYL